MSDSEGETEYDGENDTENMDFGEEEDESKKQEEDVENEEKDKASIGSGGFQAEDDEKKLPKDIIHETPLTDDMVNNGISMLCKTGDGLEIAYVKLVVQGRALTNVFFLSTFFHLRYVDLSNNKLTSLSPLKNMKFLVSLKIAFNQFTSPQMPNFPFLQVLDMSGNPIKSTAGIKQQALEKFILTKSPLESLDDMTAENVPNLAHLNVTNNSLRNLDGLSAPTLNHLYAGGNKLKSLAGVSRLTSLVRLHVRGNRISTLAGCDEENQALEYINIRGNSFEDPEELHYLHYLKKMKVFVVAENPLSDESEAYRTDVLVYARRLERIDKEPVDEEERDEAADLYPHREQDRLAAERERQLQPAASEHSQPSDTEHDNEAEETEEPEDEEEEDE